MARHRRRTVGSFRRLGGGSPRDHAGRHRHHRRKGRSKYRFDPTRPPSGTYDPALDAQERASGRGLADLTQDVGTANLRSRQDFQLGVQQENQDFGRAIQGLNRQYATLGNNQRQAASASGVMEGGALRQAMMKRRANQAWDTVPLQTGHQRQLGNMARTFQRDWYDRNTVQLPRARREATNFSQDISGQRFYQAKSTGWAPPKNQVRRHGMTYRVTGKGSRRVYTLPTGQRFRRAKWVGYVNRRRRRGSGYDQVGARLPGY